MQFCLPHHLQKSAVCKLSELTSTKFNTSIGDWSKSMEQVTSDLEDYTNTYIFFGIFSRKLCCGLIKEIQNTKMYM